MNQRSNTANNNVEDAIAADYLYSLHLSDAVNPVPMTKLSDLKAVQCGCDEEDRRHHQKEKYSPIMEDSLSLTTDNKSDEENSIMGDDSTSSISSSSDDENGRPHDLIEEIIVGNSFKDQNPPTPNSHGSDSMGVAAREKKTEIKRPKKQMSCECGAVILARSYWKHNKSRKHIDFCVWKQQRQESEQEEPENLQTSTQHPTMPSEAILPQQKRQKIISSPLEPPQEQNTSYELVSSSPPSSTASASSATHTTTAMLTAATSSANRPNAYQLTNPPAITSYPSQQQLLHYNPYHQQPSLLPNQLVWVQHPLYPYPMVMMAPPSSSFSFAPQPQPQPLSWYYIANPFSSATAENGPSSLSLPPDGK